MSDKPDILLLAAGMPINELDASTLKTATRNMLLLMHENTASGLFEGTLEMMDGEAIGALSRLMEKGERDNGMRTAPELDFEPLFDAISEHEVQEFAAALFARTYMDERFLHESPLSLGHEICQHLSGEIDDLKTRYQHEEGTEP